MKRRIALALYYGIARHLPMRPMPGWKLSTQVRGALVRVLAAQVGEDVVVKGGCYIGTGETLRVGARSQLGQDARIGPQVTIGDDVVMGPDVVIMTTSHAFRDAGTVIRAQGSTDVDPVVIGSDVWIGTRAIVLPGVTIGQGAVVGAASVVSRDVGPYEIVGGSPARVISRREP